MTLGECMVLFVADGGRPLASATNFECSIAGAEANVAVGLSRLGHDVEYVGRVGGDVMGDRVRLALRAEGVGIGHLATDPSRPTGILIRDSMRDRPINVVYHRAGSAGSAVDIRDIDAVLVAAATGLHTTGLSAMLSSTASASVAHALAMARDHAVLTSFDINLRLRMADVAQWASTIRPLLGHVDLIFLGTHELGVATDADGLDDAIADIHEQGPSVVVVKRGPQGAVASDGTRRHDIAAHPVDIIDPIGAGDAFASGFLSSVLDAGSLRSTELPAALERGAVAAALVMGLPGDITGLPDRATLEMKLADEMEARR